MNRRSFIGFLTGAVVAAPFLGKIKLPEEKKILMPQGTTGDVTVTTGHVDVTGYNVYRTTANGPKYIGTVVNSDLLPDDSKPIGHASNSVRWNVMYGKA